ncbi:MAG TPA: hypothetical protein VGM22_03740 [Methylomirabilota bacterium]
MTTEPRKSTRRRRGGRRRKPREAPPEPIAAEPPATEPEPEPASDLLLPLAEPELAFAGRAAARPPEPERPLPTTRRAIFFDVENTSRVQHISRVIDHLAVDRLGRRTDFIAVGNWRVIGHDTARLLAGHGAQLLHSAPSVGVKDWSDLRIAVAAGVWLGTARPGDVLEIISDDRAFDAVGDVATSLGITFRRLSYRRLTGLPAPVPVVAAPAHEPEPPAYHEPRGDSRGGRRRRGRRGGYRREEPAPIVAAPPPVARPGAEEPHTAPHDELLGVARDLIQRSSGQAVTLDALANALKARGFSRPPGSPRLITRLRRIRELEVSRSGQITLVDGGAALAPVSEPEPPAYVAPPAESAEDDEPTPGNEWPPEHRSSPRPRSLQQQTYEDRRAAVEAAQRGELPPGHAPSSEAPAPDAAPTDDGQRRRRSRRGGRRRRRHAAI